MAAARDEESKRRPLKRQLRLLLCFCITYTVVQVISLPAVGLTLVRRSPSIAVGGAWFAWGVALYVLLNLMGNWYLVRKLSSVVPTTTTRRVEDDVRHCSICDVDVWKKDHHCLFLGACVGRVNWPNFLSFLLHASLGASYAALGILQYCRLHFSRRFYYYAFPVTLYEWWVGEAELGHVALVALLNMTVATVLGTTHLFLHHWRSALEEMGLSLLRPFAACVALRRTYGPTWPRCLLFPTRALWQLDDLTSIKSV